MHVHARYHMSRGAHRLEPGCFGGPTSRTAGSTATPAPSPSARCVFGSHPSNRSGPAGRGALPRASRLALRASRWARSLRRNTRTLCVPSGQPGAHGSNDLSVTGRLVRMRTMLLSLSRGKFRCLDEVPGRTGMGHSERRGQALIRPRRCSSDDVGGARAAGRQIELRTTRKGVSRLWGQTRRSERCQPRGRRR